MRQIVAEANREHIPLSETEEKMLYFSEAGWTLPDIREVSAAFDRDYQTAEYEDKIANLIRGIRKGAQQRSSEDLESWDNAVRLLRKEDHYLLVMVGLAQPLSTMGRLMPDTSGQGRFLKLILVGVAGFAACAILLMVYMRLKY